MSLEEKMTVAALLDANETRFCKAYFSYNAKCDSTNNSLPEAFNASIVQARSNSIISMLNDIRITYIVDLEKMTCSCRLWDLSGIPCVHTVCAIYNKEEDPEKYLAKCYRKEMYMRKYKYALQPINGLDLW
ncbi:hypothetical protein Gotri_003896, partial [Gossypium trilobum]|nr:hypothetical protein [Gossypium trilobum]